MQPDSSPNPELEGEDATGLTDKPGDKSQFRQKVSYVLILELTQSLFLGNTHFLRKYTGIRCHGVRNLNHSEKRLYGCVYTGR